MKNKLALSLIILVVLIIAIISIFYHYQNKQQANEQETNLEWKQLPDGRWKLIDKACAEKDIPQYLCVTNCFDHSHTEIWQLCKDKGKIMTTNTGIEVLCFSSGCLPNIVNGECQIMCVS